MSKEIICDTCGCGVADEDFLKIKYKPEIIQSFANEVIEDMAEEIGVLEEEKENHEDWCDNARRKYLKDKQEWGEADSGEYEAALDAFKVVDTQLNLLYRQIKMIKQKSGL